VSQEIAMPLEERTIVDLREEMAIKALDGRYTVVSVAEMFGVSPPTVRQWRERYREGGRAGLEDRSHAPIRCPHRTSERAEELIVAEARKWGWGAKKILKRLSESHPEVDLPARSTADAILARHDLVKRIKRRRDRTLTPFARRYVAQEPGELTTIDHKGEFRLLDGQYCYPLTIIDNVSRYILACEALDSTSFERAWPVIARVFRKHGLPLAMQSDNGPPFGASNGRFSRLSVELMSLNIQPVFSRPGVPQDNGKHERMHRDLKNDTAREPAGTMRGQQKLFNAFVKKYNEERPHEGLGMNRPARVYTPSPRPYPRRKPRPEYAPHFEKRLVTIGGEIKLHQAQIFISHALAGQTIALEPSEDGIWKVHFYRFGLGMVDEKNKKFV
jgi:putative transposase